MDERKYLRINNRIEIAKLDENTYYKSSISDIGEKDFRVEMPADRKTLLFLNKGDEVTVIIYSGEFAYKGRCLVRNRGEESGYPYYIFADPHNIEKFERRKYFRFKHVMDVEYGSWDKEITYPYEQDFTGRASSVDISGGGLKMLVRESFITGEVLALHFFLENDKKKTEYYLKAEVVRSFRKEMPGPNRYLCSVKFCDIDEKKRDGIIENIFYLTRKTMFMVRREK